MSRSVSRFHPAAFKRQRSRLNRHGSSADDFRERLARLQAHPAQEDEVPDGGCHRVALRLGAPGLLLREHVVVEVLLRQLVGLTAAFEVATGEQHRHDLLRLFGRLDPAEEIDRLADLRLVVSDPLVPAAAVMLVLRADGLMRMAVIGPIWISCSQLRFSSSCSARFTSSENGP